MSPVTPASQNAIHGTHNSQTNPAATSENSSALATNHLSRLSTIPPAEMIQRNHNRLRSGENMRQPLQRSNGERNIDIIQEHSYQPRLARTDSDLTQASISSASSRDNAAPSANADITFSPMTAHQADGQHPPSNTNTNTHQNDIYQLFEGLEIFNQTMEFYTPAEQKHHLEQYKQTITNLSSSMSSEQLDVANHMLQDAMTLTGIQLDVDSAPLQNNVSVTDLYALVIDGEENQTTSIPAQHNLSIQQGNNKLHVDGRVFLLLAASTPIIESNNGKEIAPSLQVRGAGIADIFSTAESLGISPEIILNIWASSDKAGETAQANANQIYYTSLTENDEVISPPEIKSDVARDHRKAALANLFKDHNLEIPQELTDLLTPSNH